MVSGNEPSRQLPRGFRNGSAVVHKLVELGLRRPRIVVAYSGGLDSTVLTHALRQQRRKLEGLRLVHVDHGLHPASSDWSAHCARQARAWRLPFVALNARVKIVRGESLEAAARDARYALLAQELEEGEVLVTAQHLDDQVETLLLQLFRGAGVAGLAAMPPCTRFAQGLIVRPLLSHTRAELAQYAARHRLQWVEDPSNQAERFGRNFLRHRVMPLLRGRWAGVDAAIARTARHMAEAAGLLDETAQRDLVAVADGDGLNVAALRRLRPVRRRNVLRAFIAGAGLELPSTATMLEIAGTLLAVRADAQPEVSWDGGTLIRRAGRLTLEVKSHDQKIIKPEPALKSWAWKEDREFILNGAGDRLTLADDDVGPIDLDKLPAMLRLRPRRGGERLRPGPQARTQALKKLLQAARLTVEERARLPLLFDGDDSKGALIAAGDRWIDASIAANVKSRRRARLIWTRRA
jgi:tRNA(Ile)-lysidine synthase